MEHTLVILRVMTLMHHYLIVAFQNSWFLGFNKGIDIIMHNFWFITTAIYLDSPIMLLLCCLLVPQLITPPALAGE